MADMDIEMDIDVGIVDDMVVPDVEILVRGRRTNRTVI